MAWIESHTTLREHPKRKRLSRLLGINVRETIGLLHMLWWWALDFSPEGDLSEFSDEDIADSIDWEGDAHALIAALTQAGFMDDGRQIHDWDEFAEKWIARRRANAERMRLARSQRNGASHSKGSVHVQHTSGARAPQNPKSVGLPDQPDRTGPTNQPDQPSLTPQPPLPQAGEGERQRRGRRGSRDVPESAAVEAVELTPVTPEDRRGWDRARVALAADMNAANHEQVSRFEPLGRGPDGGLRLRAPPGLTRPGRFTSVVSRALLDAGDQHAARTVIVEGAVLAPNGAARQHG